MKSLPLYCPQCGMTHYYAWRNNEKRVTMYGRPCRIVARGTMNSIMIEFEDGQREIVSRRSVRRLKLPIDKPPDRV